MLTNKYVYVLLWILGGLLNGALLRVIIGEPLPIAVYLVTAAVGPGGIVLTGGILLLPYLVHLKV